MIGGEPRFAARFEAMLAAHGIADPQVWAEVETFDEVPIYSRFSELEFLDELSIAEKNRELILAAVRQLERIEEHFRAQGHDPDRYFRLVSITDWWVDGERGGGTCTDGTTELLTPHIWIGNAEDEDLENFKVYPRRSACASFVARVVGPKYDVSGTR
jgi:hypothetical protein